MLIERRLQAVTGGHKHDDTMAESHRFGDLPPTLRLDATGLGLRFFWVKPVTFDVLARQVSDEREKWFCLGTLRNSHIEWEDGKNP